MCDDTYYSAVEVAIPGKPRADYSVEMAVDITSGKVSPGCTVKRTDRAGSTVFSFDAESSCEVKVYQLKGRPGEKRKVATYSIHDAC